MPTSGQLGSDPPACLEQAAERDWDPLDMSRTEKQGGDSDSPRRVDQARRWGQTQRLVSNRPADGVRVSDTSRTDLPKGSESATRPEQTCCRRVRVTDTSPNRHADGVRPNDMA